MMNMESMKKYKPDSSELTVEVISDFVSAVLSGSVRPHLKSEEIPDAEAEAQKSLKTIVSKNLEDIVYQDDKQVFVKFYAPWCGHCKSLAPIWEELAEVYKDDDSIIIAESNAVENEFEDVQIEGLPTLLYFPKKENKEYKDVIDYKGERTIEAFVKFIDSEGTVITEPEEPDYEDEEEGEDGDFDDYDDYEDDDEDADFLTDEEEDIAYTDNIKDEL